MNEGHCVLEACIAFLQTALAAGLMHSKRAVTD